MKVLVRARALALGFTHVGFCRADEPLEATTSLDTWLAAGRHGRMDYLAREPEHRVDPRHLLPSARSIVVVAAAYGPSPDGRVAAYARRVDYHRAIGERLEELLRFIADRVPGAEGKVCVDTKPLLERRAAVKAGIGWVGKNTMVLNRDLGPWMMLGELITSVPFEPDVEEKNRCGTCTQCLDACPTSAFVAPWVLDARRCLSYWSIEHRGPWPLWIRERSGGRIFGCDDCLVSCPFGAPRDENGDAVLPIAPELKNLDPVEVIERAEAGFNRHFKRFAIARAGKAGLLRNALTALAHDARPGAAAVAERYLQHPNEGVRTHAAWSLERLAGDLP